MNTDRLNRMADETINSFDGAARATPKPYLSTRIMSNLSLPAIESVWSHIASFIARPFVAIAVILFIMILNIAIIMNNSTKSEFQSSGMKDEFAINSGSIYDIENPY